MVFYIEMFRTNKDLIKELSTPPPDSKDLYFPTQHSQSFLTQCMACLWKQHLSYWRNSPYTAVRLISTTFMALMLGSIFWDIGSKRYPKKKKKNRDIFCERKKNAFFLFFLLSSVYFGSKY